MRKYGVYVAMVSKSFTSNNTQNEACCYCTGPPDESDSFTHELRGVIPNTYLV